MSLLLNQPSMLCLGKPVLVRSSPLGSNERFLTHSKFCPRKPLLVRSYSPLQTPPCYIVDAEPCGVDFGTLMIMSAKETCGYHLEKKVPLELTKELGTIGSSHGWVATLKDGRVRLHDDLNPVASDTDPKRISLPPLVTLPCCQTQIVTNVAMSSAFPEEEDCVVAIKFLGPQLSFCRPAAQSNSEWINIRIANPCFFSSRVMFSKKDGIFLIPGSGGDIIGSWDHGKHQHTHKIRKLRYVNLPELTNTTHEILNSCWTSEHLVESRCTGETFLVKLYKKTFEIIDGIPKMRTHAVMVFKLDEEGNAVFTRDIGDLVIFLSKSEPFCVSASSFPGLVPNQVEIIDVDETGSFDVAEWSITGGNATFLPPYYIPPQNIEH